VIWGFVDYENTGSLEGVHLREYDRLLVFCGSRNKRIKFSELPSARFCAIEFIGITSSSANNLDFHLAFYLGNFHASAAAKIAFHILSNDSGFDGLVKHLNAIGRTCRRLPTKQANSNVPAALRFSECATLIVSRLQQIDDRKRPRKKTSLLNWIKSQCQHLQPSISAEAIYQELCDSGNIIGDDSDVAYRLKA
jgi:hypothetical protein